jgi:hypothetical protein
MGYAGVAINRCSIKSVCLPNPCMNSGKCKRHGQHYTCNCESTFYGGKHCEIPLYRATCAEYKALGLAEDSHCMLGPVSKGQRRNFIALCSTTASNSGATIITHDKKVK